MDNFTGSLGFVVSFLVSTLIINLALGDKYTTYFLAVVLLGMVFYKDNYKKLREIL